MGELAILTKHRSLDDLDKMMRSRNLDADGQPLIRAYSKKRLEDRSIDELIGLTKGIVADGVVSEKEASFLLGWLDLNRDMAGRWPANVIRNRIEDILVDGVIDDNEHQELFDLLSSFGGKITADEQVVNMSTSLPFNDPPPEIVFCEKEFCFTGKFVSGTRAECQNAVLKKQGVVADAPRLSTDYLVIGILGSSDWAHSAYGRKIEKAVDLRHTRGRIALVSEEHWARSLLG